MRSVFAAGVALTILAGCGQAGAPTPAPQAAYTPVPISAEDEPGPPRQVRCQIGSAPESACTLTPLFGDESFQLDGPDIAYRMVVTGNEGSLFTVFSPEHRVAVGGLYRRSSAGDACWVADDATAPVTQVCVRQ